jgi:hypothetical protein
MTDLIIGAADNYSWPQLKPWATSIKNSGFDGDVVLITYRVTQEAIDNCVKLGIKVMSAMHHDFGEAIDHGAMGLETQAHQMRNFHMWQYLTQTEVDYRYVVVTDTRDIYFQSNPSKWLDENFIYSDYDIMLPSEAITFEKEEWNARMVQRAFGPFLWEYVLKDKPACNSGSFLGRKERMKNLLLTMFLVAKRIPLSGIDQGTLNVLGQTLLKDEAWVCPMDEGWACQCGTVLDPTKPFLWERLHEPQPHIREDGIVVNSKDEPYVIVHQWDRVPELKKVVAEKYGV